MPQIDMMATGANIKQIAADKGMKAKDIQAKHATRDHT